MSVNKTIGKEADHVYVLMTDKYRISRNIRAQWYFSNLNKNVTIQPFETLDSFDNEIDLVSILPAHYQDYHDWGSDAQYSGQYFISANTKITFLSRRYRLAYVLDLSPSVSSVDIQRSKILLDEVFSLVATSLKGLVQPFYVPGSRFLFGPEIFITVIAYIPFYSCDRHQVLAQGWKITPENIDKFLSNLLSRLLDIISSVSEISAKAKDERDDNQSESDVLIGSLFDENENKKPRSSQTLMVTPDISMVNMLRFGLLALQLMPENSSAGIVIVTDGMLSLPNANTLDSALTQLRYHTISCSFLQLGSGPHPHSCFGYVPYTDLMKFISTATFGAYLSICPEISSSIGGQVNNDFNLYHRAFFAWNFQRGLFGFRADINHKQMRNTTEWTIDNQYFYSTNDYGLNSNRETRDQQIVRNKQIENTVAAQLTQLLSCRLREGYTIKSVNYISNENKIEVRLVLPFRYNVNIEYTLTSSLPSTSNQQDLANEDQPECHYEVIVEGSYNFLHDVTCAIKKPIKSPYRSATIKQFWTTLKSLSDSDKLEIHLHNFTKNTGCRNVPESIKNGVPLFYMPPNSSDPVLSSKNIAHSQFAQYWKPICMLDINICQKWMHTHRINIILEHDMPFPKHLHLANTSGRYINVQCRQALSSLSVLLKEWSSFALLENHSYIKLLQNSVNESPHSFYLIRVVLQPPCVVIHLAFIGGTSGRLRHEVVNDLKKQIMLCKFPKRNISTLNYKNGKNSTSNDANEDIKSERKTISPLQREWIDVNCCLLLHKPIEKILIRYERMPNDFTVCFDRHEFHQSLNASHSGQTSHHLSSLNMFQTLYRYLHHQRWIWTTHSGPNSKLTTSSLAKILSVITKMRIQEGFHFAHNDSGIINMMQELSMKDGNDYKFSCALQYIIFPPNIITCAKDSLSDDEEFETTEDDGELQIITECWVEPQHGITYNCNQRNQFLEGLNYKEVSQAFYPMDLEAVSCLLTFEHLLIMCQKPEVNPQVLDQISMNDDIPVDHQLKPYSSLTFLNCSTPDISSIIQSSLPSERIKTIKFNFDIIDLLPKCQQSIILFSTLFQELNILNKDDNISHFADVTNELLFELLISKIEQIHDKEIMLSPSDINSFIVKVNERSPQYSYFKLSVISNTNNLVNKSGKLRCFCKKLNANSALITIIPATYRDLKVLIFGDANESFDSLSEFHTIEDNIKYDNQSSDDSHFGSLTLPIYTYKSSFTSLSDQLVYLSDGKRWKDIYSDFTYKSQNNLPFKSFQTNENDSETPAKSSSLKQFCRTVQIIYWNSMTRALYRSLQFGYCIDKRDILKIVDNICEKTLLNIDISKFLIYVCEHLKDYFLRNFCNEPNSDINDLIETNNNSLNGNVSPDISESGAQNQSISLNDLLRSTKSCLEVKEFHSDIKNKFHQTLQKYLSPIPCFPSYYFFNCKQSEVNENYIKLDNELSDSNLVEKSVINCTTDEEIGKCSTTTTEVKALTEKDDKMSDDSYSNNNSLQILKSNSKNEMFEESASLSKSISSKVSYNAMDIASDDTSSLPNLCANSKSDSTTTNTYLDTSSQPLFLRLSCSIKSKSCSKECSLNFLPTCLQEIISLIETDSSGIGLQDLKITLNLICLTQSNEINSTLITLLQKRESVISNDYQELDQTSTEDSMNNKLSDYQFHALNECIEKINWLLEDEIASIALNSYPIRESTLEMVIKHIENSPYSDFCFKKQVQLQFVFGSASDTNHDISLNRFCDSMGQIKLPGFHLKRQGKYYYISRDNEQKDQSIVAPKYLLNSLIPALSSNISFHFNDEADLRQICSNHILKDNSSVSDVYKNNEILFPTNLSSNLSKSGKETKKYEEDLSEDSFEDKDTKHTRKRHPNRKNSKYRSTSVPPSLSNEVKEMPRKQGKSLPESDFEYIKKIRDKIKIEANDDLNETEKEMSIDSTEKSTEETVMFDSYKVNIDLSASNSSKIGGIECETNQTDNKPIQSNVEDAGYEGDSDSDSDIESLNWLALECKQPLVPKFWLIMKINSESVVLYFHTRPKPTSRESYTRGIEIFNLVVSLVESICKTVNQMLLLENLHDTRMCDDLLVPIEDNDPWNKTSRRIALSRSQMTQSSEIETDLDQNNLKSALRLMKTNVTFSSGLFSCDIVWKKHFPLHPRLQSGHSRGILAMRTVLNSFSVNNRKNLFVYQESSCSVFYLRLYEIDCLLHNYNQEIKSFNCSRSPSESSLFAMQSNKKMIIDDSSDFRNKIDSNVSDKDKDNDSVSLTSYSSSHMRVNNEKQLQHQCILLHVHGIDEVGKDIKEDMVGALQKKLDEAVLDLLIIMLSRNPHSKLTPEDVSFIQKSNKEPTDTFQFIIDLQYSEYIHSIKVYLRQNLLTIMHNPKYTESQPEHHFKINTSTDSIVTNDFDTFLYYRQQASGSDSKGIACIILSLVDHKGDPIPHKSCPPHIHVGQTQLKTLLAGSFDDVTKCERYNGSTNSEDISLIQFQIWSVGKIDLQELSKKLVLAIKHAIWDLTLEFKLLRASLNDEIEFTNDISNTISVSEPSTPRNLIKPERKRKTGRTAIQSNQINPLKRLEISRDMSSSVPNILKSILDKTNLLSTENFFKFPDLSPKQVENQNESKLELEKEMDESIEEHDSDEMMNLSCVLNLLIRPWLDYGRTLEVVTVVKQQYSVFLRHSIPHVIKEFKTYIQNMSSHTSCNAFKKTSDFIYSPCYNFEFTNDSEFESTTNMIILVRHEKLFRPSTPNSTNATYLENFYQTRSERPKLRFPPQICNIRGQTIINELNKPLLAVSTTSLNSNLSENKITSSDPMSCMAPRQKFLLLYIEDKVITLYLYNWSNEYLTNICKNLSNIISWHNSRGSFLQSVVLQKAGIFHNHPFKRKNSNQFLNSFPNTIKVGNSSNLSQYFKNQKQRFNSFSASMNENVELLIKHHNPVSAAQEYSQNKKTYPQGSSSSNLMTFFRNCSNLTPLQATNLSSINDIVERFGQQIKLCESYQSKDLQELSKVWHIQGTKLHNPILEKIIKQVKRIGRLNHYCLTPLLFSPKWRFTVSPVRDHSIQTLDVIEEDSKELQFTANNQRLRYASGGYVRKTDDSEIGFNRSRRLSGPAVSGSVPKINADESWHFAVCSHYIQEYVQYLQTLGFGAIQMRSHRIPQLPKQKLPITDETVNTTYKMTGKPLPNRKLNSKGDNERYYLIKSLLGGLLVFEVGFREPYVYSHLYSFDSKRFEKWSKSRKSIEASLSSTFLDELDKITVTMHLHSFTYDYHLRTVHSYISGRQLIFRQGYHLTSFLDDFIKYYQKAPNYARNYVYSGHITINNTSVPSHQLYNYIISHNDMYGMKVFRMNSPVSAEDDVELTNEYVLVELSSHRVPYKDTNDIRQVDNFDVGVLITHDFSNNSNMNSLTLKFFVLLTSQRELFPKMFSSHFGSLSKGSFKPIRLCSSQPSSSSHSRKSSTITDPNSDGSFTDSSLQSTKETTISTSSAIISNSRAFEKASYLLKSLPLLSTSAGICDEEINYLGYFSSHETMMLQILQDKANETESHLGSAIKEAAIDCRRDYLWSCLLPRKNTVNEDIHLSIKEFNELLDLVNLIRLDQYDSQLLPFIGHHISWYQGLAKTLITKFAMSYRNFSSPDGKQIKLVFSHSTCLDCFMLLSVNTNAAIAGLSLVLKKYNNIDNKESYLKENCSTQCHSLVEDFVNGCAYYMWSAIP